MSIKHHIGLEIAEHSFRLVEVRFTDDIPVIINADSIRTTRDFGTRLLHEAPYQKDVAKAFITDLTHLFQKSNFLATSMSIALPVSMCLAATIPVDSQLSEQARLEHLGWECGMLMHYPPHVQLRTLTYLLRKSAGHDDYLVVSIPQATVDFISSVLERLTWTATSIEPDHFIQESSILQEKEKGSAPVFAVCGISDSSCSVGLYNNEHYCGFRSGTISYKQHIASLVLYQLEKILADCDGIAVHAVQLYGSAVTDTIAGTFRTLLNIPVYVDDLSLRVPAVSDDVRGKILQAGMGAYDTALRTALSINA